MTRTKTRKNQINCSAYDDYHDHNDFLDETHHSETDDTVVCSYSHTDVSTEAGGDNSLRCTNEQVVQTNDSQLAPIDDAQDHTAANANDDTSDDTNSNANANADLDAEMTAKTPPASVTYVNVTPKMNRNNEEETYDDDVVSICTADINDDVTTDHLELDFCSVHVNEEETKTDMNAAAANNNNDEHSDYIVDGWDVLSITQHLKDHDASYVDWDVISSVQSVMSMETSHTNATTTTTKTLTYKDILANRKIDKKSKSLNNNNTDTTNNKKPSSKTQGVIILPSVSSSEGDHEQECTKYYSSLMLPILEGDEEFSSFPFDAYHELEGYKYSRGGKRPYQFRRKKNQKQKKKMTCRFSIAS